MRKVLHTLILLAAAPTCLAQMQMNHLDLSVTGGTIGIGFDLAMPIKDQWQVRAGASFMPKFEKRMQFGIEVGDYDPSLSAEQNAERSATRFNKLANALGNLAGENISKDVNLVGVPSLNNFKLLVDYFPFKENRHWHVTVGFFWGKATIAEAYNKEADMTSLMAITIYNTMRRSAMAEKPLINYNGLAVSLPPAFTADIVEYGDMSMVIGEYSHDVYAQQDILWDYTEYDPITGDELHKEGDVRYNKGDLIHKAGDPYHMLPNEENMVKVTAKTNSFRPYVGIGYDTPLTKDKRTSISFDAGIMFWGGTPEIKTHDGTNILNDLQNLRGTFADRVNSVSNYKVFPVLNLRLTRRLF